jgi:hypothetical protein
LFGKERGVKEIKKDRFSDLNGPTKIDDRFQWHQLIYLLIKELNTTEKKIYKKNYISCLNWLAFLNERNKVQENINKNK